MTEQEDEIRLKELLSVFGKDKQKELIEILHRDQIRYHKEQLRIGVVVSSCVDKETLIEDLDDKRIVGVKLNEDMWHYCRKETAEHLLDKYEIKTK